MESKLKLVLDIDGVLADWYLGMCIKYNKYYIPIDKWDGAPWLSKKFPEIANDWDFWANLPFISNPESLPDNVQVVNYLTAAPKSIKTARERWLRFYNWPNVPVIVNNTGKVDWLKENYNSWDIFIDDKPSMINACRETFPNKHIIRFIPPYLNDWEQHWLDKEYESNYNKFGSIRFLGELNKLG